MPTIDDYPYNEKSSLDERAEDLGLYPSQETVDVYGATAWGNIHPKDIVQEFEKRVKAAIPAPSDYELWPI